MKKWLCLLLCLLLPLGGSAEDDVTGGIVFDAADAAGTVVNAEEPEDPSALQRLEYTFTPLEVALIIDCSGSMADSDGSTGMTLLNYAQLAGETFCSTLMNMNPGSRIGLVPFESGAWVAQGLTGLENQSQLRQKLNELRPGGGTSTGDGFLQALQLLEDEGTGRRQVIVMITDGRASSEQDAIDRGFQCQQSGALVYTIGLVGSMSESDRQGTRRVLQAGYETAYFEVDFDSVADAGAQVNQIVNAIAMSASAAEATDALGNPVALDVYELSLGAGFNARVTAADGSWLSSYPEDHSSAMPYGSMIVVDGRKHFVFIEGDYQIEIEGCATREGGMTFSVLQGETMRRSTQAQYEGWSHVSLGWRIEIASGSISVVDTRYEVTDPYELDRQGNPVIGLEEAVLAALSRQQEALSAPRSNAKALGSLVKGERVYILAEADGYYYISYVNEKSYLSRGWIPTSAISVVNGFVPRMYWLEGSWTLTADGKAYSAPEADSAEVMDVQRGASVTLLHVERSSSGEEWAYVLLRQQTPTCGYIPVSLLEGWVTIAPDPFRLGHNLAPFTDELTFQAVWFQRSQMWKVYSTPNTYGWRGANGKAEVSTNDVVYVAGWVNRGWLLVAYETNSGSIRVGYVDGSQIQGSYPEFPLLAFRHTPKKVTCSCVLTDDPMRSNATIRKMNAGNQVTLLSSYTNDSGALMYYVETTVDGKTTRGFVPWDALE